MADSLCPHGPEDWEDPQGQQLLHLSLPSPVLPLGSESSIRALSEAAAAE